MGGRCRQPGCHRHHPAAGARQLRRATAPRSAGNHRRGCGGAGRRGDPAGCTRGRPVFRRQGGHRRAAGAYSRRAQPRLVGVLRYRREPAEIAGRSARAGARGTGRPERRSDRLLQRRAPFGDPNGSCCTNCWGTRTCRSMPIRSSAGRKTLRALWSQTRADQGAGPSVIGSAPSISPSTESTSASISACLSVRVFS